ncbi:hypothetical protein TNCT_121631 [Trichonephila clavata]|uniref:Uncharacterized protein n=1 Tax=Trichonephila clavata TaxID=2740835 RepID=A0A8X6HYD4_TRICU|nr:hypothetical protein TNCT_121631 [Trichonephila clavata]
MRLMFSTHHIANHRTDFLMGYFLSMDKFIILFYLSLGVTLPAATVSSPFLHGLHIVPLRLLEKSLV